MINTVPRSNESNGLKGSKWSKEILSLVQPILLAPDEGGCRRCVHIPFLLKNCTALHCTAVNTVEVTLKTKQNLRNPNYFKDH